MRELQRRADAAAVVADPSPRVQLVMHRIVDSRLRVPSSSSGFLGRADPACLGRDRGVVFGDAPQQRLSHVEREAPAIRDVTGGLDRRLDARTGYVSVSANFAIARL